MLRGEKKQCSICGEYRDKDCFYETKKGSRKYRVDCKICCAKRVRANEKKDPEKKKARMRSWYRDNKGSRSAYDHNGMLLRTYGIGLDDYQSMLDSQSGKCANKSCANIATKSLKRMSVDHNHSTGEVRGLLCHHCNFALGCVDDNIQSLVGLIDYLNMYDGTNHGGKVAEAYK